MVIKKFQFNPFPVNAYVLYDEQSKEAAIIDPGCYWEEERKELVDYITQNKLKVKYLLLTHLHADHIFGVPFVKRTFDIPFIANQEDDFLLKAAEQQANSFGVRLPEKMIPLDQSIQQDDVLYLGNEPIKALHVPGHSPGSIAYYLPNDHAVFSGDALFRESIGRTDLPGGNYQTLIEAINQQLMTLPQDTIVYSGHGPESTIEHEQKYNSFLY